MSGPVRFAATAVALEVVFFVLLQAPWVHASAIVPFTTAQASIVHWYAGGPLASVKITGSCSGADIIALCLGAILAYPAPWRRRLTGCLGAIALVIPLNLVRIGTLVAAASSPRWFAPLHLYIWPSVLILVAGVYFLAWINRPAVADGASAPAALASGRLPRFAAWSGILLFAFALLAPWIMGSATVRLAGAWIARAAAGALVPLGLDARAIGNTLWTARGSFIVSPACVATPLIPVYIAGVLSVPASRPTRGLALLATVPLFAALALVRLLALALPPAMVDAPLFVVHGFYQFLAFAALVAGTGAWQAARVRTGSAERSRGIANQVAIAVLVSAGFAWIAGPAYTSVLLQAAQAIRPMFPATLTTLWTPGDVQGALRILPVYQASLLIALIWIVIPARRWRAIGASLLLLFLSQLTLLVALGRLALAPGEPLPALLIRAWAVAVPVLVTALLALAIGRGTTEAQATGYRHFWEEVGEFPDLGGAASTRYYRDNERRLLAEAFPDLAGVRLLKTDLWDEAKNTRILQWAAGRGARPFGVDISRPILDQARAGFDEPPLGATVADVRRLPFRDGSFDAIYSMGTIEHFDESDLAVREMRRVLRPGGRAVIGVPNRYEPFLRPLLVTTLSIVGLYGYGYEKSFSRRAFRRLLEGAGFRVVGETAILFVPGWLRMLDLACHSWCRPLSVITGAAIRPFVWLDRHVPAVRRHGYLLATIVERPEKE